MSDKLSLSLDDIMKQRRAENKKSKPKPKPKQKQQPKQKSQKVVQPLAGKSRSRAQARKNNRAAPFKKSGGGNSRGGSGKWLHDKAPGKTESYTSKSKRAGGNAGSNERVGSAIMISNLNKDIMISDILELYQDAGNIKSAELHYNANGSPKGSAEVVYMSKKGALAAIKKYHQRELDGRPMRVHLLGGSENQVSNGRMSQRNVRTRSSSRGRSGGRAPRNDRRNDRGGQRERDSRGNRGGRGGGRGGDRKGNRGGGERRGNDRKKQVSEEDLDAEMDKYMEQGKK